MNDSETSRRKFLQSAAGGLVISSAMTVPQLHASKQNGTVRNTGSVAGSVLQTSGKLSEDGRHFLEAERAIPVAGQSQILVCGGGPAGIAAALAAARAGAMVQLIEVAGCLGGVWTVGLLTKILDAENKSGIMAELLDRFAVRGRSVAKQTHGTVYDPEIAKLVLEELLVEAGVKIRLHTRLVGAVTNESNRVVAVLTESKSGREAWLADPVC